MAKRKSSYLNGAAKKSKRAYADAGKRRKYSKVSVVPGYTRKSGYYGRFTKGNCGAPDELKFFDTGINFLADTTAETVSSSLVLIPQGDTESTRDGRKACIKSVQIRGTATYGPGALATASCVTHMWLVLDTQANGAAATFTDVFTSTAASTCQMNLENSSRFRIMKHWVEEWSPMAGSTTALNDVTRSIEYYKKCEVPIIWSSTTGAITELRSNNILLLAGATVNDDLVSFALSARVRFQG